MREGQLLIKDAVYFDGAGFVEGDIAAEGGKIVSIGRAGTENRSFAEVINAAGLFVLPGIIDSHTHLREPGRADREDFTSGSAAAAAGGVTAVCDMPNVNPPVYRAEILRERRKLAEEKSLVDVAFYGGAGFNNTDELAALAREGAVAFKTFIQPLPPGREEEFNGITATEEGQLRRILQEAARLSTRFFFHCEDHELIREREEFLHRTGQEDYSFHHKSRPAEAEARSVATVLRLAEETGAKIGICHITTPAACQMVKEAKARGVDVMAETCFHYLLFDEEAALKWGPYAKCNPPLRSREEVEGLWEYLLDGTVSMIGSDHAPLLQAEKEAGLSKIWRAFSGLPAIEAMLPLMLDQVNRGRLSLDKLAVLMSENAAKIFALYPRKGRIAVGSDADFTIVDMGKRAGLSIEKMYTKNREVNRLYDGLAAQGFPVYTIVRGEVVMRDGLVDLNKKGHGKTLFPTVSPAT
ncbi:MAG: dihydroorotase [Clostridiales bacterium]|nr:dihydroorotase [Clostridiales bacterium]